jgi:hypothetical protein
MITLSDLLCVTNVSAVGSIVSHTREHEIIHCFDCCVPCSVRMGRS